jgi:hypothetical protein
MVKLLTESGLVANVEDLGVSVFNVVDLKVERSSTRGF